MYMAVYKQYSLITDTQEHAAIRALASSTSTHPSQSVA